MPEGCSQTSFERWRDGSVHCHRRPAESFSETQDEALTVSEAHQTNQLLRLSGRGCRVIAARCPQHARQWWPLQVCARSLKHVVSKPTSASSFGRPVTQPFGEVERARSVRRASWSAVRHRQAVAEKQPPMTADQQQASGQRPGCISSERRIRATVAVAFAAEGKSGDWYFSVLTLLG